MAVCLIAAPPVPEEPGSWAGGGSNVAWTMSNFSSRKCEVICATPEPRWKMSTRRAGLPWDSRRYLTLDVRLKGMSRTFPADDVRNAYRVLGIGLSGPTATADTIGAAAVKKSALNLSSDWAS